LALGLYGDRGRLPKARQHKDKPAEQKKQAADSVHIGPLSRESLRQQTFCSLHRFPCLLLHDRGLPCEDPAFRASSRVSWSSFRPEGLRSLRRRKSIGFTASLALDIASRSEPEIQPKNGLKLVMPFFNTGEFRGIFHPREGLFFVARLAGG